MTEDCAQLYVADHGESAVVRICGRANFVSSVPFKKLINGLMGRGCGKFTLDLSNCHLMDSTFIGVLVGLSRKFEKSYQSILLFGPSEQVQAMFDNLGVLGLFGLVNTLCEEDNFDPIASAGDVADKSELTKNSIEAHKTLMGVSRENELKFKEVARFLEENLEVKSQD